MKNLFLMSAIAVIFILNSCRDSAKEVPLNIKAAFSQKFANAEKVKWEKENETEWEAEFIMEGKEYSANFDMNGTWKETEYEISMDEIPVAVKMTLKKEFAYYKVEESDLSETATGKVYEFDMKKDGEKTEVTIDTNGVVVKKDIEKY